MKYLQSTALLAALLSAVPASAEEVATASVEQSESTQAAAEPVSSNSADQDAASEKDWNVAVTPYLWAAGTKGDIAIPRGDGNGISIDKSFADVLSKLNFAFMGAVDVEHRRFVLLGDVIYVSVGADVEGIQDPGFLEGEVDTSVFVVSGAAGYRVIDQGAGYLDLFAGARVVSIKADVELTGPLTTRRAKASPSNVAPLFGARARLPLGPKWGLTFYGDVAGIVDSEVKWQLVGTVQRDLGRHWRLIAGYRHIQLNHDKNNLDFDVALSGPLLGVSYRF